MAEDIDKAEKNFGTDVSTLKVITTRKWTKVVVDDFIEIPRELIENNQELIICMEIMFINQQELFTTIDKYIRFCGSVPLSNITQEECYRDLDAAMRYYNKAGFSVKHIECDDQFK